MSTERQVEWDKVDEVMSPVRRVLNYDLERLRRTDEVKRIGFWNDIESSMNTFEEELLPGLPRDLGHHYVSESMLAKLLLGTASHVNGEDSDMANAFNDQELVLVQDFERLNTFDILSTDDICERIARRDELFSLVREIYEKQYGDLDRALDSAEVQRDIKLAFKKRYQKRLDHIKEGVKAYVDKYGPVIMVKQIEDQVWGQIKESQREREEISAEVRSRLEDLTSQLGSLGDLENESEDLKRKLSEFWKAAIEGDNPDPASVQSEKEKLLKSLSDFEDEFMSRIGTIGEERKKLEEREAGLQRLAEGYRRQAEEEKQRIVESELNEIEKTRSDLASKEQSLEEERNSLDVKRQELNERLR